MRLINTDTLKYRRKYYGGYDDVSDKERKEGIMFLLKEDIDNAPTIDAVPVMRCADCKWWGLSEYNTFGIHVCKKFSGVRGESDYCSRAERSDNGET